MYRTALREYVLLSNLVRGVQFENELGPLSEEETKVSRKFVKFIMEFAIKECLDNTPTFCL
jgi:hypothetical protein